MGLNEVLFAVLAFSALASAVAVVMTRNTVHAALHFVGHLLCLAGIYSLLHAPLLGVLQVMVYAGAVMVLFLFAVMILDMGEQEHQAVAASKKQLAGAILAALILAAGLAALVQHGFGGALAPAGDPSVDLGNDNIASVARVLFRDYALAFEAVGLLLLTAVVAVMVMAKRKLES
jgi:NADH-quinone oxidoreductase subunit J